MSADRIVRRARTQARGIATRADRALVHLVLHAFEEHDEGVGGDTDRDDEAGDAGQAQREPDLGARA